MRASRSSHSTVSKGWTPGVVKRRRIDSAFAAWTSCAIWGANSIESLLLLPRFPGVCGVRSGGLDGPRIVHLTADGTAWAPCGKRFPQGYSAGGRTPRRRRLLAMPRRALPALCLLAAAMAGCGGGKKEDAQTRGARKAAEAYVHDLGNRDGEAVCGDVTAPLRKQITDAVVRAN